MCQIAGLLPDGHRFEFTLPTGLSQVGRGAEHLVSLPVASVSRTHAEMECDESGRVWLTDLNSTNGTFVGGQPITVRTELTLPCEVVFGALACQVKRAAAVVVDVVKVAAEAKAAEVARLAAQAKAAEEARLAKVDEAAAAERAAAEAQAADAARQAAEAKAAEDTRAAAAANAAEEARIAAEKKAVEEQRLAAEAKAAEEARAAAAAKVAEEARLAAEMKAAEEARAAAERQAAEEQAAEEARLAAEAKAREEARIATEKKAAEETLRAQAAEAAEEKRLAAEARAEEVVRLAAAAQAAEEARVAAEKKAAEEARLAAAEKAAEGARILAERKAAEEARLAAEEKAAEEARILAEKKAAEEARLAVEAKAAADAAEAKAAEETAEEAKRIAELRKAEVPASAVNPTDLPVADKPSVAPRPTSDLISLTAPAVPAVGVSKPKLPENPGEAAPSSLPKAGGLKPFVPGTKPLVATPRPKVPEDATPASLESLPAVPQPKAPSFKTPPAPPVPPEAQESAPKPAPTMPPRAVPRAVSPAAAPGPVPVTAKPGVPVPKAVPKVGMAVPVAKATPVSPGQPKVAQPGSAPVPVARPAAPSSPSVPDPTGDAVEVTKPERLPPMAKLAVPAVAKVPMPGKPVGVPKVPAPAAAPKVAAQEDLPTSLKGESTAARPPAVQAAAALAWEEEDEPAPAPPEKSRVGLILLMLLVLAGVVLLWLKPWAPKTPTVVPMKEVVQPPSVPATPAPVEAPPPSATDPATPAEPGTALPTPDGTTPVQPVEPTPGVPGAAPAPEAAAPAPATSLVPESQVSSSAALGRATLGFTGASDTGGTAPSEHATDSLPPVSGSPSSHLPPELIWPADDSKSMGRLAPLGHPGEGHVASTHLHTETALPTPPATPVETPAVVASTQASPVDPSGNPAPATAPPARMEVAMLTNARGTLPATPQSIDFEPMPPGQILPPPITPQLANLKVLILGDSLSLCGFGARLDQRFRENSATQSTNTYMACGMVPNYWLKSGSFAHYQTSCGFHTIESTSRGAKPKVFEDTYGLTKGHKPGAYTVPKLEDLVEKWQPDVLVMQTGTNLLSMFHGAMQADRQGPLVREQVRPFLTEALSVNSSIRKIYWVSPPISGKVSGEIQDFVLAQVRAAMPSLVTVIDSRPLVSYPYQQMQPDQEHFFGKDMTTWADSVYDLIQQDLTRNGLPTRDEVGRAQMAFTAGVTIKKATLAETSPELVVVGKLRQKSSPLTLEEIKPYQESLVSFVYEVETVEKGSYTAKEIVVMHPAHIGQKTITALDKLQIGKDYRLRLRELDGSAWNTIKSKDDSGQIDLLPYIQTGDEGRLPARASAMAN